MLDPLLQIVAPHHCYNCQKIGHVLCNNCKYDIISEPFLGCIGCRGPAAETNVCKTCQAWWNKAWCVGERSDVLRDLIDAYKFGRSQAVGKALAGLLDETLPVLPTQTIVTAIPTIASHVRLRGYDHAGIIAHEFARRRHLAYRKLLRRRENHRQLGASRNQRIKQAETAFYCKEKLAPSIPYLLIDDVLTTGATLMHGARVLGEAGAEEVWAGIIARQPLDA